MLSCSCNDLPTENKVMKEMCYRLFPEHSDFFLFELMSDSLDKDRFTIESIHEKIKISGNNNNSLAAGLNHYLRYYCNTNVSWYAFDKVEMPQKLPAVPNKLTVSSKCKTRFFLNYCTFGYTMPYWKWSDWERLIDWMALNGVTMPLAITGQESIWYRVWTKMGLTDEQIRSYFTGPAHLPWHRMSNVDYWQSPLPKTWLENQEQLQKLILQREREFNMTPVLPAFTGHVPRELKEICPNTKIHEMSQWGGYSNQYRSHFIDPMDSLYTVIQKIYLEEQTKVYGTDHIYGIDPFNEVDSPDWSEDFLSNVSKKIYESIHDVDSTAQWLQMTWMFYHNKEKWTKQRISSFLNAVPDNKLILLDYYCDSTEIWRETEQYYGKPYIWCYLGNFGGNSMMVGNLDEVDYKINRLFTEGGKNVFGVGATLEGFDVNPIMYEFVLSRAWDFPVSTEKWTTHWAMARGGKKDIHVLNAWELLHRKIYTKHATAGQAVLMNARPKLVGTDSWNTFPDIHYNNNDLWEIWKEQLKSGQIDNQGYLFDVTNVGRQVLGNLFSQFRDSFTSSYRRKHVDDMRVWANRMDTLLLDVDRLLSCETAFSIGKWIKDARDLGGNEQEKKYYEENARCILTTWGEKATQLNDYANRGWGGLTRSYYRERWYLFTNYVINSVVQEREVNEMEFYRDITNFEYQWTLRQEEFPLISGENAIQVSRMLKDKYSHYFEKNN